MCSKHIQLGICGKNRQKLPHKQHSSEVVPSSSPAVLLSDSISFFRCSHTCASRHRYERACSHCFNDFLKFHGLILLDFGTLAQAGGWAAGCGCPPSKTLTLAMTESREGQRRHCAIKRKMERRLEEIKPPQSTTLHIHRPNPARPCGRRGGRQALA